ncbi:acyl-CoA dehydrogenase [Streptomyces tateyamensis]|uniref:Acyl-CoA dehydrogenase n=1 Tax=Streptomyces tateyamensis TaxID=565073 RepID=A0A2V4MTR9_9ACTN|nr:acyl-CoA carboxylase subunit epsilon [Streptomyces tateyamensis]PYC67820.1 acyl-CoA dehydrogenase [Streptomyces tateyamensis]
MVELDIVRGEPTAEEIAAVTAVLLARAAVGAVRPARPAGRSRAGWDRSWQGRREAVAGGSWVSVPD